MKIQLEILAELYEKTRLTKEAIVSKQHPKNQTPSPTSIHAIDQYMASIKKQAVKIGGPQGLQCLLNYHDTKQKRMDMAKTQVDAIMKKAFWDKISQALSKDKPDWSVVISLTSEARDLLCDMCPRDTREIKDALNIDLFTHMISCDIFHFKDIIDVLLYMIDKILMYGPESQDEKVKQWRQEVSSALESKEPIDMAQFLPKIFAQIMHRLTSIQKSKHLCVGLLQTTKQI